MYFSALEYVSIDKRAWIGNIGMAIGLPLGGFYLPWLIKYVQDWKIFHHIVMCQAIIMCLSPWLVSRIHLLRFTKKYFFFLILKFPWVSFEYLFTFIIRFIHESGRWLITKGRVQECISILKEIAKTNRRHVPENVYMQFQVQLSNCALYYI